MKPSGRGCVLPHFVRRYRSFSCDLFDVGSSFNSLPVDISIIEEMARVFALALLLVPCTGETPVCATVGTGYSDLVNGEQHATTDDAKECQDNCKRTDICAFFTWYPDTKGCWLQSSTAIKNVTFDGVVSGPVRCPGDVDEVAVETVVDEVKSGKVGKVVETLNSSTGASFPWWAWVLIGLGIAFCGLCILSFICCSTRKKSSKRSQKVSAKKDVEAAAPAESAPLMTAAPQVAAPAGSIRSMGAAPVASGYAGSGVYGGSPVYTGAQYQYQPAPMTYAQAAPVATGPQDLFTQLDTNGDGVLSPPEMAAMQAGLMRPAVPAVPAGFTQVPQ